MPSPWLQKRLPIRSLFQGEAQPRDSKRSRKRSVSPSAPSSPNTKRTPPPDGLEQRLKCASLSNDTATAEAGSPSSALRNVTAPAQDEREDGEKCNDGLFRSRNLWSLALESLRSRSKDDAAQADRLAQHAATAKGPDGHALTGHALCEDLVSSIKKKRHSAATSRWIIKAGGRSVSLQGILDNVLSFLDKFKEAGDIAVSFDPIHAALPWAVVRFLLEAATSKQKTAQQLLVGMDTVTYLTLRCNVYEQLYLAATPPAGREQAYLNLETAIVALYTEILSLLGVASSRFEKHSVASAVGDIFSGDEVSRKLQLLSHLEARVNIDATVCGHAMDRQAEKRLGQHYDVLQRLLCARLEEIDTRLGAVWDNVEENERRDMLQWISQIAHETDHYNARSGRTLGTGEWLLHHTTFAEWIEDPTSSIIWLHGIPGAGKTKLCTKVVDSILTRLESSDEEEALAYFYCDRNRQDHSDPLQAIRSLVRQLSVSRDGSGIVDFIRQAYLDRKRTGFASSTLTIEECTEFLQKLVQCFPRTTLVLDGLDECNAETRGSLIRAVDDVVGSANDSSCVKVFIASRNDDDLKSRYLQGQNHEISAADNQGDIEKFVLSMLEANEWCRQKMSAELRVEVQTVFREKSQAMFQWAALHIGDLVKYKREKDIRQYLLSLPKGLKRAYDDIYYRIQSREGSAGEIATRAFQWLMCSWRPLRPQELVIAACQDPSTSFDADTDDVDIDYILEACHNLITITPETSRSKWDGQQIYNEPICRFSHLSVQEYLEQHHWTTEEYHSIVARICLRYLTDDLALKSSDRARAVRRANHTFHGYVDGWFRHVGSCDSGFSPDLQELLEIFLGDPFSSTSYYRDWIRHTDLAELTPKDIWRNGNANTIITLGVSPPILARDICQPWHSALCGCICMSLHPVIRSWIKSGRLHPEARVGNETILALVTAFENTKLCRMLVEFGANVNAPSPHLGTALQASVDGQHGDPVKLGNLDLLLKNGADVNLEEGTFGTALQRAAWRSPQRRDVLELLLGHGADVNAHSGQFGTALQSTAYNISSRRDPNTCHEAVSFFLERGADPNIIGGGLGSALQAVASLGDSHIETAKLLIEYGADVNQVSGEFGTPLQAAAWKGVHGLESARLLFERGAQINIVAGKFGTALQAAVMSHYNGEITHTDYEEWQRIRPEFAQDMVSLLLKHGADMNLYGGKHCTALHAAAIRGRNTVSRSILMLLLDHASNTGTLSGAIGSTLQAAATGGLSALPLLETLVHYGADVNAGDADAGTALHEAVRTSKGLQTDKFLLDCGADVNAPSKLYGTPLHAAVSSGNGEELVATFLLEHGANMNNIGGPYGTVLQAATASPKLSMGVIRLLIQLGANVNATGGKFGTALNAAFCNQDTVWTIKREVVMMLIRAGANYNPEEYGIADSDNLDLVYEQLREKFAGGMGNERPESLGNETTSTRSVPATPVVLYFGDTSPKQ